MCKNHMKQSQGEIQPLHSNARTKDLTEWTSLDLKYIYNSLSFWKVQEKKIEVYEL